MVYSVFPYWQRPQFRPVWSRTLRQSLELIRATIEREPADETLFGQLIALAPSAKKKQWLASIREDERGHRVMLRDMYKELTGNDVSDGRNGGAAPLTYERGLAQALFRELDAVGQYRLIWFGLPANSIYRDTVLGIILDEQKHAQMMSHLLLLARTGG